jgi:hypothetical protein
MLAVSGQYADFGLEAGLRPAQEAMLFDLEPEAMDASYRALVSLAEGEFLVCLMGSPGEHAASNEPTGNRTDVVVLVRGVTPSRSHQGMVSNAGSELTVRSTVPPRRRS